MAELAAGHADDDEDAAERQQILEALDEASGNNDPPRADLAKHFLEQARLRYEDVFKRAENVERRAAIVQGSVVFAITLTLTGGALLLDGSKVPDEMWRESLAVVVAIAVFLFVVSGLLATFAAVWLRGWKVVGPKSLYKNVSVDSLDAAQRVRAASYLWCVQRNMAINGSKGRGLMWALIAFLLGLFALLVLAVLLAAYAIDQPPIPAEA